MRGISKQFETIIKVGMNSTSFNASATEINRKIRTLDSAFKSVSTQAKIFGESTETLKRKQEVLSQKISMQTQKVSNLKIEYEKSKKETGENSKETDKLAIKYNYAINSLTKFEGQLKSVSTELEKQTDKTVIAQKKLKEFGEKAESVGKKTGKIADGMLKIGGAMTAVTIAGAKVAFDFEDSMAKVSTIADTTKQGMEKLSDSVINLSNKYGKSAGDISNALYETLSAGVKTKDSIKFLDNAVRTSITGFTDVTTSVNALTNVINAYGIETNQAGEVTDKLLVLQKFGKTTIGEFGNNIGKIAPLSAQANVSINELFGSIATLTKNSIKSDEALTGMKAIISNIIKPSVEASKEAERLGLKFNASALKSKGFAKFLEDVMRKTHGNTDSLTKLFGSVEALNAVMLLTSKKGSKDFKQALDNLNNSSGMTDEAMAKMDTKAQKARESIQKMKNAFLKFGEAVAPVVINLLKVFTPIVTFLGKLNPKIIEFIAISAIVLTFVGSILKLFSSVSLGISGITQLLPMFNLTFGKTALVIGGVVLALTALLTLIVALTGHADDVGAIGDNLARGVNSTTSKIKPPTTPNYINGSHKSGLQKVPYDGYIAELHEDEEVLTANDPRNSNNFNTNTSNNNVVNKYYSNNKIIIDAHNVKDFTDVIEIFDNLEQTNNQYA